MRRLATGAFGRRGRLLPDRHVFVPGSLLTSRQAADSRVGAQLWVSAPTVGCDLTCLVSDLLQAWGCQLFLLGRGERAANFAALQDMASVGSQLLSAYKGNCRIAVSALVVGLIAPHVHVGQVDLWFGFIQDFPAVDAVLRALSPEKPIHVLCGGWLGLPNAYENYRSVEPHLRPIQDEIRSDVLQRCAMVFNRRLAHEIAGLRVLLSV